MGGIECIVKSGLANSSELADFKTKTKGLEGEELKKAEEKIKSDFINDYHKILFDELNKLKTEANKSLKEKLPIDKYNPIEEPDLKSIHEEHNKKIEAL